jgi:CRISPR-associated protein Cas5d
MSAQMDPFIALEIAGPAAMFTRPDTGATPISYPVPTYSAVKGIFDAILWRSNIYVRPTKVEVCRPVRYERYVTNYGGPLRKTRQIEQDNNYQLLATVLVDVCYRLFAEVKEKARSGRRKADYAEEFRKEFERRLSEGQTFYTPCLGWKEFAPSYVGPLRAESRPEQNLNLIIPSLLHSMWEDHKRSPTFRQNVEVRAGVLRYETEGDHVKRGLRPV